MKHHPVRRLARHIPVIGQLQARPVLAASVAVGVILYAVLPLLLPSDWRDASRALVAWNGFVLTYLTFVSILMGRAGHDDIRRQAAAQDEGRVSVLIMTIVTVACSLAAIVMELGQVKELSGAAQAQHVGLAAVTVVFSWLFLHTMFAVHYAHEFYTDDGSHGGRDVGGLDFPGDEKRGFHPNYWDFMYFSFVIGAAAQTADVCISSRALRCISVLHGTVAFFFNTTILALTVNIGASLF